MRTIQAGFLLALLAPFTNGQSWGAPPAGLHPIAINFPFAAAPLAAPGTSGNQIVQTPTQIPATMISGLPRPDIFVIAPGQNSVTLTSAVAAGCTPAVYRNGVLMAPGYDYTISGQTVTFVPDQTLIADDKVQVWYVAAQ